MPNATEEFLDAGQYARAGIHAYETVFGRDFVSPGGAKMARHLIGYLALPGGSRVLDVGCGLGGSAFLMAREFALVVDGIDLSTNMIDIANERLITYALEQVQLWHGDCLELDTQGEYDAVYSRDVFLHIHDKERLFHVLHRALRPGASLLFTDYCGGERPWSKGFNNYVETQDYRLHTIDEYVAIVESAGFIHVVGEDATDAFIDTLEDELAVIECSSLDSTHRQEMTDGWREKLARAQQGEQRWILMQAKRRIS